MWKYCFEKIMELVIVMILLSFFAFAVIYYAPGDVSDMYISMDMTEEEVAEVRERMGVTQSMSVQYIEWLREALKGNLGVSFSNRMEVVPQILSRMTATFLLMGTSMLLSLLFAIPLGLLAGYKENTWIDNLIGLLTNIGMSVPSFWLGMILIILFSAVLHLLPIGGMYTIGDGSIPDLLKHLIMPCMALSFGQLATYVRYIRTNTIRQLHEEYVLTAEAKGTVEWKILFRHVLKNTLFPVITLVGMNLPSLVCGSFITETVFGWPGAGMFAMTAIGNRDYPIIMAYVMMSGLLLVVGNFATDLLYTFLDPRVKRRAQTDG